MSGQMRRNDGDPDRVLSPDQTRAYEVAERPSEFVADVPPEPRGLLLLRDRDGDLWRFDDTPGVRDGRGHRWLCEKRKTFTIGGRDRTGDATDWTYLVVGLGPLRPVEWSS